MCYSEVLGFYRVADLRDLQQSQQRLLQMVETEAHQIDNITSTQSYSLILSSYLKRPTSSGFVCVQSCRSEGPIAEPAARAADGGG